MFHKLIVDEIRKIIPETYQEYDFRSPVVYPMAVYTIRYSADPDEGKYRGTLEIELVDNNGDNHEPIEEKTFELIRALHGKLLQNDRWFVSLAMSPPGTASTIPALDDQINRKLLQFTLNIDRRFI